jgi:hypothetical protein
MADAEIDETEVPVPSRSSELMAALTAAVEKHGAAAALAALVALDLETEAA